MKGRNRSVSRADWAAGALCVAAVALALHTGLSAGRYRSERAKWEKERAWIEGLERGDDAAWAWRKSVERRGAAHPADAAEAVGEAAGPGAAVAKESASEEPLGSGWTRVECTLRVRDADFAGVARALDELADGEPGWRLLGGEWTAGAESGRGEALLVLEALDYSP